jgi:cell division protein FtsB
MANLVGMATTTSEQPFSRIVETKKNTSWTIGVPIAIFVVVAVALIAYFAAKNTQAREQLAQLQQSAEQNQQRMAQVQQKIASLDAEVARLRDPGRTTVILQSAAAGKRGKARSGAWAAATWGEQPDVKTWMRVNAYGLGVAPSGKNYDLWFVSAAGDSILVGKIEPNTDGSGYVEGKDLPRVDQGKSVLVSLDDGNAKTPGQAVSQAPLPKMTPSSPAATAASDQAAGIGNAQPGEKPESAQGKAPPPNKR